MNDSLGDRMKGYYEARSKTSLIRRMPVIIRLDGKAFHTFTRGFQKPFDRMLMTAMQRTMEYLCSNIQGCVLGYTQSDEITLVLTDYEKLTTEAWFDYEVQKLCSITASMATLVFNDVFGHLFVNTLEKGMPVEAYNKAISTGALFDARCFNIPKEEVTNCILWRQLDATRNSIQMVGQANFSHKELQNKNCNQIQEMLFTEKGINWNDFPTDCKRGSCCIRYEGKWVIDKEIPIFKGEDRDYIENLINCEQVEESTSSCEQTWKTALPIPR